METPEGLNLENLQAWFPKHIPDSEGTLVPELIAGGKSNLTFTISTQTRPNAWVLRRPPLGHVVATAHDMTREFTVMSALGGTDVPVPRAVALCTDSEIIGAPFYVMEYVPGRILRTAADMADVSTQDAREISGELIDVLARLHSIDYQAVGLGEFGRPDGFLARNVTRWGKQWAANKTAELASVDELARRLETQLPESGPAAIVHGDYRLDNTMIALTDNRVTAVLDWEMSTLGDPLTDLGLFLVYWGNEAAPEITSGQGIAEVPGFMSSDEIVSLYEQRSGRSVEHLDFYVAFAMYKLAIIVEGINARHQMGKTVGEGFDALGALVGQLIDAGLETLKP